MYICVCVCVCIYLPCSIYQSIYLSQSIQLFFSDFYSLSFLTSIFLSILLVANCITVVEIVKTKYKSMFFQQQQPNSIAVNKGMYMHDKNMLRNETVRIGYDMSSEYVSNLFSILDSLSCICIRVCCLTSVEHLSPLAAGFLH